jgi:ACR3 family arsenite efflux pump ArsB
VISITCLIQSTKPTHPVSNSQQQQIEEVGLLNTKHKNHKRKNIMGAIAADLLLFFLVFGMSATTDIAHVRKQLRNRNALLTGISLQFIILPFVGFVVVKLLRLDAPLGITLLVVTSSPGGSYSNWYVQELFWILFIL